MYKNYTNISDGGNVYIHKIWLIMRLTTVILLATLMQVSAATLAQRITMQQKKISFKEVFKQIKLQTGYNVVWKSEQLKHKHPVTVNFRNAQLDEALDQILPGQGLDYTVNGKTIVIRERKTLPSETSPVILNIDIRGQVLDEQGLPLAGVSIKVKDTSIGTSTDASGRFSLNVPEGSVLVISIVGYATREIAVAGKTEVNVTLQEDVSKLTEVVVTGYSSQGRNTITTAVSKLDNKILDNVPFQNVATAMQGAIPGVRVQSVNGQPGAAPRIIVRGGTSINSPNSAIPLYIVDGVIRSDLDNIAADDIESMQVLKDAAATSIYGARGSNGVVLVKTKSGKPGTARVTYSYNATASNTLNDYEFINAREYLTATRSSIRNQGRGTTQAAATTAENVLLNDARAYGVGNDFSKNTQATPMYLTPANEYKLNEGWESMADPADPTKTIIFKNTDFSQYVWQKGLSHNHHVGVSGGSEKSTFGASVGYLAAQGTIRNTDYHRLTMNLNGDVKVRDNLSFSGRVNFGNSGDNAYRNLFTPVGTTVGNGYTATRYAAFAPTNKYAYEDAELAHGRDQGIGNPDYYLPLFDIKGDELKKQKLALSLGSHWEILPGLSFDPQVSMYNIEYRTDMFQPSFYTGVTTRSINSNRITTAAQNTVKQQQVDALLNYKKQFAGTHNISAGGGFTYFGRDTTTFSATGRGAATNNIPTLNASLPNTVDGKASQLKIASFLYGINYDFQQKYLLTLNGRYDGASNLGAGHKWGFFPGVSVGWNMHQENFWKQLPGQFSGLKLRASYGVNGNISGLGDYESQGTYAAGPIYLGNSAIQNTAFPLPDLQWEQSKTLDFGADIGLFGNRVNILFDVFSRITDHLLTNLSLPPSTGFGVVKTNYGSLKGRGIELELSARIMPSSSAFQWETSFNAAQIKNRIHKLPPTGVPRNRVNGELMWISGQGADAVYDYKGGLQEGGRIGDMFAFKQIGVYATDADAASAPTDLNNNARNNPFGKAAGGDVIWQDTDGNGTIDFRDKVYMGNPYPVWTGGFSNYFTYKNMSLSVRMDYATGHTNFNEQERQFAANATGDSSPTRFFYESSWKQQGDVADVPRYVYLDPKGNLGRGNSIFYTKGDYLALREVTLSYTIPVKMMEKIKMNSLRLSLSGYNLHYFKQSKRNGVVQNNPEEGGNDNGRYSLSRDFIFGANLTF